MESILSVENVSKYFGSKAAVEQFSLSVGEGEIFGLLGPNGAGKTTLIKMIVGHLRVDAGSILICGHAIGQEFEAAMGEVGAIVENPAHYLYMSGYDNLKLTAMLHAGIERGRLHEVIEQTGLQSRIHDKVKRYSLGMRQRLALAQTILRRPKLLVLDEPTNGLDPAGIKDLRGILQNLAKEGMAIVVSSHILSEMSLLCTRVGIMRGGSLVADSSAQALQRSPYGKIRLRVGQPREAVQILESQFTDIAVEVQEDVLLVDGDALDSGQLNRMLVLNDVDVYEVGEQKETLEDAFMELTGTGGDGICLN